MARSVPELFFRDLLSQLLQSFDPAEQFSAKLPHQSIQRKFFRFVSSRECQNLVNGFICVQTSFSKQSKGLIEAFVDKRDSFPCFLQRFLRSRSDFYDVQ